MIMQEFAEDQDVIVATEIASAIGADPWEIKVSAELAGKFREITDYMAPFEDRAYIVHKLSRGRVKEDAINHVWRYVTLRKEFEKTKMKFEDIKGELGHYE